MRNVLLAVISFCAFFGYSQTKEQDSLAISLAFKTQDSAKVETSVALIKSLYKSSDFTKALQYATQVEKLATKIDYKKPSAEIQYYKGLIFSNRDDYYNAINSYERSKTFYQILKDSLNIARVNNNIGLLEIKRGNYGKGLQLSASAIAQLERQNLKKDLSIAYSNLAEAYYHTKRLEKALEFNKKALAVREELKDTVGIKESSYNIANLFSERKEHHKAIEYYNKTLSFLTTPEDALIKAKIYPTAGEEYVHYREYKKASDYLIRGLQLNKKLENNEGILKSYNALALLNFKLRKYKLAYSQLDKALVFLKNNEHADYSKEFLKNYKYRMQTDSALKRFKNAYYWQTKFYELKKNEPIAQAEQAPSVIEDIDNDSTTKPKTVANSLADTPTSTTANQDAKTDRKLWKLNYLTYGLIAALLAVLAAVLFLYNKQKSIRKKSRILELQHKKIVREREEMLEQTKHLEETNQVKDRLFSIVSHDLKDSVSSIKGCLDLLKDGSISNEEFKNLVPELSENADNASQLLYDLLNWSKTQMQNLEPDPENFDIQDVFKSKIHLIEQKLEQKRVTFIDESKPALIHADKNMIEIVIQNLLANAIKFSRVGDVITVSNRERNGNILICVEDTGIGISDENQKRLFTKEAFTTVGTGDEKGTGLGLSICKELVELNKGSIWVKSERNLGSKFFIELPRANQ